MKMKSYIINSNYIFIGLVVITIACLVELFSEWKIYHLKNNGRQTEGIIKSVDITDEYKLEITYSYSVDNNKYTGNRFYPDNVKHTPFKVKQIRQQLLENPLVIVFYSLKNYQNSMIFISKEEFSFYYMLLFLPIMGWGFWFGLYFRLKKN